MSAAAEPSRMRGRRVVALSGGVGGARFLHGLARAVDPELLTILVNTGDDFEHWGLSISPDVDTVMYTLANLAHEERGWGLSEETFHALEMMRRYGGEDWFALGDRDLATHLLRSQALARGDTLTEVTARLCKALGVRPAVLPMADGPCRTRVDTKDHGTLSFQDWFVRHRAAPPVQRIWFEGCPPPGARVLPALQSADLVVIGPSNPYVSIDPILHLPGVRSALSGAAVLAVSPIVKGHAVKGPLAGMIGELAGEAPTPRAIATHYGGMLAAMVVERGDEHHVAGIPVHGTETVMRTRDDSLRLAREVLSFAESILP
jgi:LPPG:FO 2-phospho-L-lactate transferase